MKLTHADELLLHRFLDGEVAPEAAVAFEARLAAEPLLRRHLERAKAMRAGFAAAQAGVLTPSPGFTAGVIAAARRLPSRQEMEQVEVSAGLVRACRRLLIAAAVVFGISLAWNGGLIDGGRSDTLEAAPTKEVADEMKRLDALIESVGLRPAEGGHPAEHRAK